MVAKARAAWPTDPEAGVGGIAPERLVFLDECGMLTNAIDRKRVSDPAGLAIRADVLAQALERYAGGGFWP